METPPAPFPAQTERPSSPPSPAALACLRGRDADGRVQSLVAERAALRPALGLRAAGPPLLQACAGDVLLPA